jgi:hypothetical protein
MNTLSPPPRTSNVSKVANLMTQLSVSYHMKSLFHDAIISFIPYEVIISLSCRSD